MSGLATCENCRSADDLTQGYDDPYSNVIPFPKPCQESILRSADLSQELKEIYADCKEDNWDAQNASAIPYKAIEEALFFIDSLHEAIPLPDEVTPSSDGSIDLEWYQAPYCTFNLLFYGDEKVIYAGLFGEVEKHHGVVPLKKEFFAVLDENIKKAKHAR